MPFYRAGTKLIYFAHVPKAGGMALTQFASARTSVTAFTSHRFLKVEPKLRWSRTSPQHIDVSALERLIPLEVFDACFTVVRHPVDRLISAFHFQKEREKSIPRRTKFSKWVQRLEPAMAKNPYLYDNHVRPMDELVPASARVFYLEDGLDALVPWFDDLLGNTLAPRTIELVNTRKKSQTLKIHPTADDLERIARLYRADFERFDYEIEGSNASKPAGQAPYKD